MNIYVLKRHLKRLVLLVFVGMSLFYLLGPPSWMIKSSISSDQELRKVPPNLFPQDPTFSHFRVILQLPGYNKRALTANINLEFFTRATYNTLVIAGSTMIFATLLSSVLAYWLTRFVRVEVRKWLLLGLLLSRMLPLISVLIPIYVMLLVAGMLDTLTGLILVYTGLLLPFAIWIQEGFYRQFPRDLEEAATIDGASPFTVYLRIVLPLSWNSFFATGAFVFISTWADFIVGFIMTSTEKAYPISVAIARDMSAWREPDWGVLNAAGLFAALIPVIMAFALRGLVMRGRFAGAVKG